MEHFKETYEFFKFIIALVEAGFSAAADGKITLMDYPSMIPAILAAPNAFEGLHKVSEEYRFATTPQRAEFHEKIAKEFSIPNDRIETLIEEVLVNAGGLFVAVSKFINTRDASNI